jgi:hypothetical protein
MTAAPIYFTPEWAPPGAAYFRCERLQATIQPQACATNWERATSGAGMLRCRGCPVGPLHSGDDRANAHPLRGQLVCSRCERGATRLVQGWLCISCYNRAREWVAGRNAKGSYPSRMQPLQPRAMAYTEAGEPRLMRRPHAQSQQELMVGLLRDSAGVLAFVFNGRPNIGHARTQGELF